MKRIEIFFLVATMLFFASCSTNIKETTGAIGLDHVKINSTRKPSNFETLLENIGLYDFDNSNEDWIEIRDGNTKNVLFRLITSIDYENSECTLRRGGITLERSANRFICTMQDDESYMRIWQYKDNSLVYKIMANKYILATYQNFHSSFILALTGDRKNIMYMKMNECSPKKRPDNTVESSCTKTLEWDNRTR